MKITKMQKLSLFIWTILCASLLVYNNAFAGLFAKERLDQTMEKLVNSGIEHISKAPKKDMAYKDFSDVHGKFVTDMDYLFVYDFRGKCLAHGGNPNKYVDKNLLSYKDKFGIKVIKLLIDVAKSGGGFAGYYWPNPKTEQQQFRVAYVKKLDKDTLIGTSHPIPMD